MIAASVVLTVTAAVLFIVGLLKTDGTTIIWASIGASALALASLIVGVLRGRKAMPETIGGVPVGEVRAEPAMREAEPAYASGLDEGPATLTAPAADLTADLAEEDEWVGEPEATEEPETTEIVTASRRKPAARKATTRKPTARKPAARKPAAAKTTAKKTAAKTTTAAKTARKPAAAKTTAKKTTAKKTAAKPAARKPAARKSTRKPT